MNRKGFIGGSDCVQIMDGNWLELWEIKTGRVEPVDLRHNLAVQLGIYTEDFNLKWFERETQSIVGSHQKEFVTKVGRIPVKGTIDGAQRGTNTIVEAKHTNTFNTMDSVIERYMPQIQLYSHISGADGAWLSVIFGNSKYDYAFIEYNEEYFNSMWAVVSDFWGYVERDEEPIGYDLPILKTNSIPVDEMVVRDASHDNAFVDAAVTYHASWHKAQLCKQAEKDLKGMVADNEREVYCDYLTIKRDKRGALRIKRRTHDAKK